MASKFRIHYFQAINRIMPYIANYKINNISKLRIITVIYYISSIIKEAITVLTSVNQ